MAAAERQDRTICRFAGGPLHHHRRRTGEVDVDADVSSAVDKGYEARRFEYCGTRHARALRCALFLCAIASLAQGGPARHGCLRCQNESRTSAKRHRFSSVSRRSRVEAGNGPHAARLVLRRRFLICWLRAVMSLTSTLRVSIWRFAMSGLGSTEKRLKFSTICAGKVTQTPMLRICWPRRMSEMANRSERSMLCNGLPLFLPRTRNSTCSSPTLAWTSEITPGLKVVDLGLRIFRNPHVCTMNAAMFLSHTRSSSIARR